MGVRRLDTKDYHGEGDGVMEELTTRDREEGVEGVEDRTPIMTTSRLGKKRKKKKISCGRRDKGRGTKALEQFVRRLLNVPVIR